MSQERRKQSKKLLAAVHALSFLWNEIQVRSCGLPRNFLIILTMWDVRMNSGFMHKCARHWRLNHTRAFNALWRRSNSDYAYNPYFTVNTPSEACVLTFHPAAVGVSAIKHKENIHFITCMCLAAGKKKNDGSHVRQSLRFLTNEHFRDFKWVFFVFSFPFKLQSVSPFLLNEALILSGLQYAWHLLEGFSTCLCKNTTLLSFVPSL